MQVGLVLTRLLPMRAHTPDLFHHERDTARERLHHTVDSLNQTFGHGSVYFGGAFGVTENAPMRISFTRIPAPELEEIDPARERRVRPRKVEPLPPED
jgi:DNA polymerase-4